MAGEDGDGRRVGGFQSSREMVESGSWDVILGDPSCYHSDFDCLPTDPHMIEAIDPRGGANPVTGDMLSPPASGYLADSINGHERTIPNRNELQYSCIFPLIEERGCEEASPDSPLCQSPRGQYDGVQRFAKSYPGLRQLLLLKSLEGQGIVGSIYSSQLADPVAFDYGYRPAVGAIVERLSEKFGGPCLQRSLHPDAAGQVRCSVVQAVALDPGSCVQTCDEAGLRALPPGSPVIAGLK